MVGAHLLITGVLCFCLQASVHGTPSSLLTVKKMVFHALLNIAPLCVNIQVSHIAFIFFSKFPYASQVPNNKIEVTTGNSICFFYVLFFTVAIYGNDAVNVIHAPADVSSKGTERVHVG